MALLTEILLQDNWTNIGVPVLWTTVIVDHGILRDRWAIDRVIAENEEKKLKDRELAITYTTSKCRYDYYSD